MNQKEREQRRALVERVLEAARPIADPHHQIGRRARAELLAFSGLSPEGIDLALSRHLEIHAGPEEIGALIQSAGDPERDLVRRVFVVSPAHVCVAPLRAFAFALARSPVVRVKPSRRDPVLARLLVDALNRDKQFLSLGGSIACVDAVEAEPGDEIHAYGSDATLEALRARAGARVRLLGFGSGFGVAVIGPSADPERAAQALARDVIAFDQRGCLSPRILLIEGDAGWARTVCEAVHQALLAVRVPRGELDAGALSALSLYRAGMEAVGWVWAGPEHAVALDESPRALILPPPVRVLHAAAVDERAVPALLAPLSALVTTVGVDDAERGVARTVLALCPRARRATLGCMQTPPLDGPVDRRIFGFFVFGD